MNKIIYSLFFFLLILGCKKDSEAPILELSETTIKTSSLAENHSFSIVSNRAWKVISSENGWITINPISGNNNGEVTIAFNANNSSKERSLVLTVRSEELEKSINLIQDGASPEISLNKSSENVDALQNTIALVITTNEASWTSSGVPEWMALNPAAGNSSGNVNISVSPNTMASTRSATIIFTSSTSSKSLTITQAAASATLSLDKTSGNVNSTAGSFVLDVTTNGATWSASGIPSWITMNPVSGSSSANVNLSYQANTQATARNATITFTYGTSSKSLTITQAGASTILQLSLSKKQVSYQAGSVQIELTTNNAVWKINSLPDWISANPLQGDKSGTITLDYQVNTLKEKRSAQIVFSAGNVSQTLLIEQLTSIDANDGGNW